MELHSCFQYSKQNVQEGIQWFYYRGAQHYPGESSFFGRGGGGGVRTPYPPMDPHINTEAVIRIETGV